MKPNYLLLSFFVLCAVCVNGQTQNEVLTLRTVKQDVYPAGLDNYYFGVIYYNGTDVYAINRYKICSVDSIDDLKINPSYTSFATLEHNKKGQKHVGVYRLKDGGRELMTIKRKDVSTSAIAYSRDAKQLAVGFADKSISVYKPMKKELITTYSSQLVPTKMRYSDNNYFLAAADQHQIEIWNIERANVRKTFTYSSAINDFVFTQGSTHLQVLTADGILHIYDTKDFTETYTVDDLGNAVACWPNKDGKYVSVVNSDKRISVINILDPTERQFIYDVNGGVSTLRMVYSDIDNQPYLIFPDVNNIVFRQVAGLKPFYNKMMTTMLNERLNQWMKQMPAETLEAYHDRVNETTREIAVRKIERDIATRMATGLLGSSEITVGNYNTSTGSLALHFNSMPDIYLNVPVDELNSFEGAGNLEFRNVKYGLNPDDKFELIYAEVFNPTNGKTYVFDNLDRQSLSRMQDDSNFVPLEIIQRSNMEETALVNIKENVISLAQQNQVISDKTHISVKTEAVPAVNADGEKIVNYNVGFTYEVDEEFSARDDFKPGHYHTDESKAAMLMLQIMKQAFQKDFAKYMVEGKRVKIIVKGTADASLINRALSYDGKYGEFEGEPVYKNKELSNISLDRKGGIADNDQLAFARALGVQNWIEHEISDFSKMGRDYEYHIEVSEEEGSKYRRISVQYTFIDAQF